MNPKTLESLGFGDGSPLVALLLRILKKCDLERYLKSLKERLNRSIPFATIDAEELSGANLLKYRALCRENGEPFIKFAEVDESRIYDVIASLLWFTR